MNKCIFFSIILIKLILPSFGENIDYPIPNAIIKISVFSQNFNKAMPWLTYPPAESSGSGFVIEGNRILTNAHVVCYAKYIEIKHQDSSKKYIAQVKHISHPSDIAELTVSDNSFFDGITPLKLGELPKLNSKVQTIGFPIGGEKISITTGIISRIEKIIYSHSGVDEHLAIQTDAAINPGNSGGPVLQNGLVVGMAFQGIRIGDNIGYMIPTTIIHHFLNDAKDGTINGTPEVGVFFNSLPPLMKNYLKIPKEENGIIIIETHPLSEAKNIFKKNDILTEINGYKISDDGTINLDGIIVPFYEIVERCQYGEEISFKWYRNGEKLEGKLKLKPFHRPISVGSDYELDPEYFIFSGLVFINLSGDYFRAFSKEWWNSIPFDYKLLYYYQTLINQDNLRISYVTISQVLPSNFNSHAIEFTNKIIDTVNGHKILSLQDLKKVIENEKENFFVFKFMNNPVPLIIEKELALSMHKKILEKYNIKNPFYFKSMND